MMRRTFIPLLLVITTPLAALDISAASDARNRNASHAVHNRNAPHAARNFNAPHAARHLNAPHAAPVAAVAAVAKETPEYHAVVKLIESHYRVKHRGIPFVANLGVKTAKVVSKDARRALRFGDFKLAIFEDQDFSGRETSGDLRTRLRRTLEPHWHPLVAARLEEEGQTYTYTKADEDKFKVLIVVIGQRDATVLQVNLNPEEFAKLLLNPEQQSRELTNEATSAEQ